MKSNQKNRLLSLHKKTIAHLDTALMRMAMGGCAEDSATSCASCVDTVNNTEAKLSLGTCADGDTKTFDKPPLSN